MQTLKTSLDHLPARKQRDLEQIVAVLHEEFADKIKTATQPDRKLGRILKIILFGSHARGDWVEDRTSGYFSDYDILVIVSHADFTDMATYWGPAEDRLMRGREMFHSLPQFIVHTLDEVNTGLTTGQYFFTDIIRDGVLLYELTDQTPKGQAKYKLATPTPPDQATAKKMAQEYYEHWIESAKSGLKGARFYIEGGDKNDAAFLLHQTTERAYTCFLLTKTLYNPSTHNIKNLRSMAEAKEEHLRPIWPRGQKPYDKRFELLKKAYVEARYSKHYEITAEELEWLLERVEDLVGQVDALCQDYLNDLK